MSRPRSTKSPAKRTSRKQKRRSSGFFGRLVLRLTVLGLLVIAVWAICVDIKVRRDIEALLWALPARIYARPVELYVGAQVSASDITDTLQRLGYRRTNRVSGPGEYSVGDSVIRLWTRGFDFWD